MDINFVAVVGAAIASMAVGSTWFSQSLFGKAWLREAGISGGEIDKAKAKGMGKTYAAAFVGALITAYVLAYFVGHPGMASAGATIGFWAWLGFLAPVDYGAVLWQGKSVRYFWIITLHNLVSLLVMGAIIGAFN